MSIELTRRGLLAAGVAALAAPRLLRLEPARAQDAVQPLVLAYPRQVGELEVTAMNDGYFEFASANFLNIAPEDLEAALAAAYLDPATPTRIGVTAHLVRGGGRTVLIDSGTAEMFGPTLGRLPAALTAFGVAPEAVDAILLTHMHPDHIGGLLPGGGAPAFPNATVHVSEADLAFWTDEAIEAQAPEGARPFFERARATAAAYGERIQPFTGDVEILPGITSLALPGHTVGHTGFRLVSGGSELLVSGDVINSTAVQFLHPEASITYDTDPVLAAETRKRLFDMLATDRTLVAGTHVPFPSLGHVDRSGAAYAWVPEDWRYG